jgi:hypothetical protein
LFQLHSQGRTNLLLKTHPEDTILAHAQFILANIDSIQEKSKYKELWAFDKNSAIYVPTKVPKMEWSEDDLPKKGKPIPAGTTKKRC